MTNLSEVYYDNLRTNQIGDNDGISPEVARDLGFSNSDDVLKLRRDIPLKYIQEIREQLKS